MITLKLDLEVAAHRVLHQIKNHNDDIEKAVENGVKAAFEELASDDNFELLIKERTKEAIISIVDNQLMAWQTKSKLQEVFRLKMEEKMHAYAEKVINRFTEQLDM